MVLLDLPMSRTYFMSVFERAGVTPNIAERTRDMAVMRSLVANGFGFSVANIRPHSDLSPDGRALCFIPIEGTPRPLRLGFVTPVGARRVLSVDAFIDHAGQTIAEWNYPGLPIT
jgi:DNA-binding transcriptional LysR family regulator